MATAQNKPAAPRKTRTNWMAFIRAKVGLETVTPKGYKPYHMVDWASHTRIPTKPQNVIDRMDQGGGFVVRFKQRETGWAGWKDFADQLIEISDFRCGVCHREVPIHPEHILKHMLIHQNANRRAQRGGEFWVTLTKDSPIGSEEDAYLDDTPEVTLED